MIELPCRARLLSKCLSKYLSKLPQSKSLFPVMFATAALFSAGCAQLPTSDATHAAPGDSSSLIAWPTPTLSNSPIPAPPEPTLLPRAERPVDKSPEILRNVRRSAGASGAASMNAAEAPRDVWQRIRGGFQMSALDSKLVQDWETYYATRPEYFARMIENSRPFATLPCGRSRS